ncbi:arsenate reductase [Sphingomonas gellani]|uniref:Arsenate reductase n=1 Tax=Sphingomonas gellani TaxID=1166340 RepID=A0A1H7YIG8_9SPHN|nr:arsenate reductase (glutaredoxin) [Sphingomonas gellani]SEM45664.1 arsenate reductase [Sphingomonas gellani]
MKATIYHNPRCSKSREALRLLREAGAEVVVVEYLKQPPSRDTLAALIAAAGVSVRDALRAEAGASARASDEAALTAMVANPALIERPIVVTEKGVVIARPPERALTFL